MSKRNLGVAAVFLVGCAIGGASRHLVPKANAQQAATLTKWEITCFRENDDDDAVPQANRLGAEGWDLVGVSATPTNKWCFKRPKM